MKVGILKIADAHLSNQLTITTKRIKHLSFDYVFLTIADDDALIAVAYALALQIVCGSRCSGRMVDISDGSCGSVWGKGVEVVGYVGLVLAYIVEHDAAYNIVDEFVNVESCFSKAILDALYDEVFKH